MTKRCTGHGRRIQTLRWRSLCCPMWRIIIIKKIIGRNFFNFFFTFSVARSFIRKHLRARSVEAESVKIPKVYYDPHEEARHYPDKAHFSRGKIDAYKWVHRTLARPRTSYHITHFRQSLRQSLVL